jgi:hypothetical protein
MFPRLSWYQRRAFAALHRSRNAVACAGTAGVAQSSQDLALAVLTVIFGHLLKAAPRPGIGQPGTAEEGGELRTEPATDGARRRHLLAATLCP